jgi:hypothetical protein
MRIPLRMFTRQGIRLEEANLNHVLESDDEDEEEENEGPSRI